MYPTIAETNNNVFCDEDGLGLKVERDTITDNYIMTDNAGNVLTFVNRNDTWFLSKIKDSDNNELSIKYDSNSNKIVQIVDSNKDYINITYEESQIKIKSLSEEVILHYNNGRISDITSPAGILYLNYNEHSLIAEILDISGIKYKYEYYAKSPYRARKIIQYGLNDSIGQYFELDYGLNLTTIIDNLERYETIMFNSEGNVTSRNSLSNSEDIEDAYSIVQKSGNTTDILTNDKNKIIQKLFLQVF